MHFVLSLAVLVACASASRPAPPEPLEFALNYGTLDAQRGAMQSQRLATLLESVKVGWRTVMWCIGTSSPRPRPGPDPRATAG